MDTLITILSCIIFVVLFFFIIVSTFESPPSADIKSGYNTNIKTTKLPALDISPNPPDPIKLHNIFDSAKPPLKSSQQLANKLLNIYNIENIDVNIDNLFIEEPLDVKPDESTVIKPKTMFIEGHLQKEGSQSYE
jgi:hypothetical protein